MSSTENPNVFEAENADATATEAAVELEAIETEVAEEEAEKVEIPPNWPDPRNARIEMLERMLGERETTLQTYIRAHKKAEQDFEAYKSRLERDRQREVMASKAKFVEKLLDVEDNLERAIEAATRGGSVESLAEGARLVHKMFRDRLAELGLERIDPTGMPFDPSSMEALGMLPVDDPAKDNTVAATLRVGYRIGDTEIRPALVQVGKFFQ